MWLGITTIMSCIPYLGSIAGIAALVIYIIYWVKNYGYRDRLNRHSRADHGDEYDRSDNDFEDRRRHDDDYEDRRPRDHHDDH